MDNDVDVSESPQAVAERIVSAATRRPPRCGQVRVVAIDGGAASGKSSLANAVYSAFWATERHAELIRTDDLLDGWSDQFGFWPRLRDGVLEPLAAGGAGRYRRYNWLQGSFGSTVIVPMTDVLIVEGVSSINCCAERAAYSVFLDVPRAVREQRWMARETSTLQPEWVRWLDAEDEFFAANTPTADLVVR